MSKRTYPRFGAHVSSYALRRQQPYRTYGTRLQPSEGFTMFSTLERCLDQLYQRRWQRFSMTTILRSTAEGFGG
jgi:hypothetical protein